MRFSAPVKLIVSDPVHFLAFGFGAGLSTKAPGTMGTLVALPFVFLLMQYPVYVYLCVVFLLGLLGIYLCGESARRLGVHDHPGIVWDEFVGMAIAMIGISFTWLNLLLGFILFRMFDIFKPWPIRLIDRRVSGGLGIMLDDVVAGIFAWFSLQAVSRLI
jgi:phosphatidylglycerophosphatase A